MVMAKPKTDNEISTRHYRVLKKYRQMKSGTMKQRPTGRMGFIRPVGAKENPGRETSGFPFLFLFTKKVSLPYGSTSV